MWYRLIAYYWVSQIRCHSKKYPRLFVYFVPCWTEQIILDT